MLINSNNLMFNNSNKSKNSSFSIANKIKINNTSL